MLPEANTLIKNVYNQYAEGLKRYVQKKIGSIEDAEDIVQDTFCKLLSVNEQKMEDNPAGYTYKVAHNLALNRIRKNVYHANYVAQTQIKEDTRTPERSAVAQYDLDRVVTSLNNLPSIQVKAFTMSRFDYKTYTEIGEELNVSVSAVEKYVSKTLLHLKTHFSEIAVD